MPIEFEKYDWLKVGDLERCPFVPKELQYSKWHKDDDRRMLLIALDRYANYITTERIRREPYKYFWNNPRRFIE